MQPAQAHRSLLRVLLNIPQNTWGLTGVFALQGKKRVAEWVLVCVDNWLLHSEGRYEAASCLNKQRDACHWP